MCYSVVLLYNHACQQCMAMFIINFILKEWGETHIMMHDDDMGGCEHPGMGCAHQ